MVLMPSRLTLSALTTLGLLTILSFSSVIHAANTLMTGSIVAVPDAPTTGPIDPHKAWVTRKSLKSDELSAKIEFEVALKMRNFDEFQGRVNKGERVPPQERAAKYDPLASDYQATIDWLKAQGFEITQTDVCHLAVFARGTVSQIQSAMNVNFGRVSLEGKEYTSAISEPSMPASLAAALIGVNGLQPHHHMQKHSLLGRASLSGPGAPYLPQQIATAYSASGLYTNNLTGSGQTTAIVIDLMTSTTDLESFWSTYGIQQSLSNVQFIPVEPLDQAYASTTIKPPEAFVPDSIIETSLDVEWSSSIAPGSKVRAYTTATLADTYLDKAYTRILNDATNNPALGIHQMSMSYGGVESQEPNSELRTDSQDFVALNNAGVTAFASSGDGGSTPNNNAGTPTFSVLSPASFPNVTGVGGTSLTVNSNGIPSNEVVWNNSILVNGTVEGGAGGGGASTFYTSTSKTKSNGTSTLSWTWQTGNGISGNARLVPDIALTADPDEGAVVYFDGSNTIPIGGTSWSSPVTAAFFALINQARADAGESALGAANPLLYPLLGTTNFRDITSGNNVLAGESSLAGTTNGVPNYTAGAGYDETTGIGVPVVGTLAQTLVGAGTTLFGIQSPTPFENLLPGQNATFKVTATGASSFQWQRLPAGTTTWIGISGSPSGSPYSGTATTTLTVTGVTKGMSGDQFQCVVTFPSKTLTSTAAMLAVETPLVVEPFAGSALNKGSTNGTGTGATFSYPAGVALDNSGNAYIADGNNNVIREITPAGLVSTPYTGFSEPNGVARDNVNNLLYVADTKNNLIRQVTATGTITSIGTSHTFKTPLAVAVDSSGNVYVADSGNNEIVKITTGGTTTVIAGNGAAAYLDSTTGTSAEFDYPTGIAVDGSGNIYVADFDNCVVRKITSSGAVSTFAGTAGVTGYLDGEGTAALFNAPNGVGVDGAGNIYVTDGTFAINGATVSEPNNPDSPAAGNNLLRKITPAGVVTTIAGDPGITGTGNGAGTAAQFYSPQAVAVTSDGEFFIADTYNQMVREAGAPPSITGQPVSQVVTAGQSVTLAVVAAGAGLAEGQVTYQWQKDGSNISGANSSTYMISATAGSDSGGYDVVVTSPFGNITSNPADVVVLTAQPVATTATSGNNATFSVTAPTSGPTLTYQWLFNGTPIQGATSSSFTITDVTSANAGNYSVTITDSFGSVTTTPVALTVNTAPVDFSDSPTMPPWALICLAGLLFVLALPRCSLKPVYGSSK
jgi:kumamolisin